MLLVLPYTIIPMKEQFEAEMRLLNEQGQKFAERYPEQAKMLNLQTYRDHDPYVERLLEGFAFLTAHIKQKIDDGIPEISENLLQQLWPQMLRPLPAMTIIQFKTVIGQPVSNTLIPKGTAVTVDLETKESPQICKFTTTSPLTLHPLEIIDASAQETKHGDFILKLDFQAINKPIKSFDFKDYKIYLAGSLQSAIYLHFILTAQVKKITVICHTKTKTENYQLKDNAISPSMLSAEEMINPDACKSLIGFHLLQEYFAFKEKYLFLKLSGLEQIQWPEDAYCFTLVINTKIRLPDNYPLTKNDFSLYCVPAINLFDTTSEPILFDNKKINYCLLADLAQREHTIIHSVKKLYARGRTARGERSTILPNTIWQDKPNQPMYNTIRTSSGEVCLAINNGDSLVNSILSGEVAVCNGNYPYRHIGEKQLTQKYAPQTGIEITNLTRPTPMYIAKAPDFCWALISHLSLNYSSLASAENLQALLRVYNWTGTESNSNQINSIMGISITPSASIQRGAIIQTAEIKIIINEALFSSLADINLFGLIMHNFFSMYAYLNFFVITKIICDPSGKELTWQPLAGIKQLI